MVAVGLMMTIASTAWDVALHFVGFMFDREFTYLPYDWSPFAYCMKNTWHLRWRSPPPRIHRL